MSVAEKKRQLEQELANLERERFVVEKKLQETDRRRNVVRRPFNGRGGPADERRFFRSGPRGDRDEPNGRFDRDRFDRDRFDRGDRDRDFRSDRPSRGTGTGFIGSITRLAMMDRERDRGTDSEEPASKRRLISTSSGRRVVRADGAGGEGQEEEREKEREGEREDERPTLASAVASSSNAEEGEEGQEKEKEKEGDKEGEEVVPRRRVLRTADKPAPKDQEIQKRNRRLFATGLLGQLKKARTKIEEDKTNEKILAKEALEQKALQRAEEERRQLAEEQRQRMREERQQDIAKRQEDLTLKFELLRKAKETELELLEVKAIEHEDALSKFLVTRHEPRLYFAPASHTDATRARLDECQAEAKKRIEAGGFVVGAKEELEEWDARDRERKERREKRLAELQERAAAGGGSAEGSEGSQAQSQSQSSITESGQPVERKVTMEDEEEDREAERDREGEREEDKDKDAEAEAEAEAEQEEGKRRDDDEEDRARDSDDDAVGRKRKR